MIDQKFTSVFNTEHRPVETGVLIADEGIALVFVKEGSSTVVRPSTGAAGEIFAGVSTSRNVPPLFLPLVLDSVAGADIVLPRTPLASQILVRLDGSAATIVAGAPAAAGEVQIDDMDVNFHAADIGKELTIQMMYEPTVSEARQIKGDMPVGGLSSSAQGVIGMIVRGDVATSYFDASADFSGALTVKLGAGGLFTVGGAGTTVPGCTVQEAPSAANPTLVLAFH